MNSSFIHLRLHTEFSLKDSCIRLDPLIQKIQDQSMPAVAITDFHNLFALVKFYKKAQSAGIKPIIGVDFSLQQTGTHSQTTNILLLAQNQNGYKNLIKLISRSYREGQMGGRPNILNDWLEENADGLIALSGAQKGAVGTALSAGRLDDARDSLKYFMGLFPDRFYIELQRTTRYGEEEYIKPAIHLANELQCPVVATNDVCFLNADEFEAHEARVCINEGRTLEDPRRDRRYSEKQFLRSSEDMSQLFKDIPEAIVNSLEIAKRCSLEIDLGKYFLPEFAVPDDISSNDYFINLAKKGLQERLSKRCDISPPRYSGEVYSERLENELLIITEMGFTGYFLIVMDFILWAKHNDIPVGPGRGSGAGSLVAYALKITDIDPLEYDLLFERFLNPERVSLPDFDIDFCMEGRDRVIDYVAERYGRAAVSQIVTFGTMAAKAVVRDVARVLGKSYSLGDKLSKMIPFEVGMTLKKAFDQEEDIQHFIQHDVEAEEIWALALQLEGITRNCGKHAGGVVIAPTQITDFTPIYCDENGSGIVTQFDKNDVEEAGLVKFDFLGLRTLTIINSAVKLINQLRIKTSQEILKIEDIPLDDISTFELMARAETTAVFQLESRGMKELIRKLGPDRFEDIIALVALFRPGPLQSGMVDDFINRKKGLSPISYPHPKYQHECLKSSLESTYGVILYQEQVMQIAREMGGYTLGGADLLRRAMGKKDVNKMAEQRSIFIQGAIEKGFTENLASNVFELMEKFAGYGFNKSHSAAYALIAYQTAWLKTHYPAQFMAATISSDMDKTDKVVSLIDECRVMELTLMPPDINSGEHQFSVSQDNHILYGLGAIKGIGEGPVNLIIEARKKDGNFSDLFDLCERVDARKVNKRIIEALIRAGALDDIGPDGAVGYSRAVMLASISEAMQLSQQKAWNEDSGIDDLFADSIMTKTQDRSLLYRLNVSPLSAKECLEGEKDTLGLFLTGHPIDEHLSELDLLSSMPISKLRASKSGCQIAGILIDIRIMKNKRGENFAILTIDDKTGRVEVSLFAEKYNIFSEMLVKDSLLVISGSVSQDEYSGGYKILAESVRTLYDIRCEKLNKLELLICNQSDQWVQTIEKILADYRNGNCRLYVTYSTEDYSAQLALGEEWQIKPCDDLLAKLKNEFGETNLRLHYE